MKNRLSLFISFFVPPLGLPVGLYGLTKENKWKTSIFCIALAFASYAYCFVPTGQPDLVRYFEKISLFDNMSLKEALLFKENGYSGNLYSLYIFFWVVAHLGDYHIAPAVTTMGVYYIGLYITCRIAEDLGINLRIRNTYICFLIMALNYYGIINNVRNVFAFSIILYAIFRDCYEYKRDILTLALYLFAIFFHTSAILFLGIRVAIEFKSFFKYALAIFIVFVPSVLHIIYPYVILLPEDGFLNVFRFSIIKAYRFFNDTNSEWGLIVRNSGSQKLARVLYISIAIVIALCAVRILIDSKIIRKIEAHNFKSGNGIMKMLSCALYSAMLTIACVPMLTPEYWRFASAMILVGGIVYFLSFKNTRRSIVFFFSKVIFIISPVCMLLWMREFKASRLLLLLFGPFFSSPIIIFLKNIVRCLF